MDIWNYFIKMFQYEIGKGSSYLESLIFIKMAQ